MLRESFIFLLLALATRGNYVSLDLAFSADSATVPSRALLAHLHIGIPEQRYGLMLDFNASRIELDQCLRSVSRTFNVARKATSDDALFEKEEFMDPELRDYIRLPVVEHCGAAHSMPERFYDNCLSERCNGIIGLSTLSGVWEIWTAFTLSLESLHLGRSNPFFRQPPSSSSSSSRSGSDDDGDEHVVVDCRRNDAALCEFDASVGGVDVVVDFHTHDSYIYVPQRIYALYMSGVSLDNVHGSKRLRFNDSDSLRGRKRSVVASDGVLVAPPDEQRRLFHERLNEARQRHAERSIYYRNSLHRFTMSQWLPLVVEISRRGALVLDSDLLVHSPSYANSYAGAERSASEHFFGESAGLQSTVLLKPQADARSNRVSIGNGLLRRYTLHVDVLRRRLLIEPRVIVEHLTSLELIAVTVLFLFFLRSVCYSLELLAPLSLCVERRCPGCEQLENTDKQHRRVSSHSMREALFFLLALAVPFVALVRLPVFVPYAARFAHFYVWAWTTLAVNGVCLLANLFYSATVARGQRPASGSYCWRSFRVVLSRAACSEQLALLGIFCLTVILRREALGTQTGAVVGFITLANATRHVYQAVRFGVSASAARRASGARSVDRPHYEDDRMWGFFVLLVLLLLNCVGAGALFATSVFWPVSTFSRTVPTLMVSLSLVAGVWIVHQYSDAEMQRSVD